MRWVSQTFLQALVCGQSNLRQYHLTGHTCYFSTNILFVKRFRHLRPKIVARRPCALVRLCTGGKPLNFFLEQRRGGRGRPPLREGTPMRGIAPPCVNPTTPVGLLVHLCACARGVNHKIFFLSNSTRDGEKRELAPLSTPSAQRGVKKNLCDPCALCGEKRPTHHPHKQERQTYQYLPIRTLHLQHKKCYNHK